MANQSFANDLQIDRQRRYANEVIY